MFLYEMTVATKQLYELLANEEIDEQTVADTLEAMGVEEKLEGYCQVIRQYEAEKEMYKAEKERIEKKIKVTDNAINRMKKAVIEFMKVSGSTKSTAGTFTVALSTSKAVNILDENKIPVRFLVEQAPKIDKSSIRAELMSGAEIEGCELQVNEGVRIK
jgi:hypothetical protein